MLRILINGIWAAANTLLSPNQNPPIEQRPTSKWRAIGNFLFSTFSSIGIPLFRSMTETDTLYECVNTLLANPTTRNHHDHHERHNSNLSRHSRPNFRRRSYHNSGTVRIIKPTIHVHIH